MAKLTPRTLRDAHWHQALMRERARRIALADGDGDGPRLIAQLDQMAERMRGHEPPLSPERAAAIDADLEEFFAALGIAD